MGRARGVSYGGGQSSLGYLFGNGEAPKPSGNSAETASNDSPPQTESSSKPGHSPPQPVAIAKQIPAGIQGNRTNNYFRADGQNCGNFLTDRPSTKVHAAPGGGSSLDYLFGSGHGGNGGN